MPRSERHRQRVRADIALAAARVFARSGYRGAKVQDIAREAGYTAPTLYKYFASKADILRGLMGHIEGQIVELFEATLPASIPFEARLEILVRRHLEWVSGSCEALVSLHTLSADLQALGVDTERLVHRQLVAWLTEHARPGELGGCGTDEAAMCLHALGHALFVRFRHGDLSGPLANQAPRIVALFLHGVQGAP